MQTFLKYAAEPETDRILQIFRRVLQIEARIGSGLALGGAPGHPVVQVFGGHMPYRIALILLIFAGWAGFTTPAVAQGWGMVDTEGAGGAGAYVCAEPGAAGDSAPCFRVTCENDAALHYEIALFSDASPSLADQIAVELRVDGRASGLLLFQTGAQTEGMASLSAPFDPRLHGALIEQLRKGNRAGLVIQNPAGAIVVPLSLRGSSKSLGAVMEACPLPEVPLDDPAAMVLDEIVRACGQLEGSVAMEPGFERHEDLDGDGRDDVVIDYAAAVCSEMASLYCGSGGCTVGFFLARGEGFSKIFDGVIRGYTAQPGGLLALDLHGTACGLYGFEACRKVFRIADDSFALVEEIAGIAAQAAQAADRAAARAEAEPKAESARSGAGEEDLSPAQARSTENRQDDERPSSDTPEPAPEPALEGAGEEGSVVLPAEGEGAPGDLAPERPALVMPTAPFGG
ncbi:MAG: hypothetical protein AUK37_05120 [Rhodobacterales bacterium CG2_30_65_12]|nr:MAG: hypothetical protein AUK37_05120 [Rhodobacterales bacterium CG2_30_65_12]